MDYTWSNIWSMIMLVAKAVALLRLHTRLFTMLPVADFPPKLFPYKPCFILSLVPWNDEHTQLPQIQVTVFFCCPTSEQMGAAHLADHGPWAAHYEAYMLQGPHMLVAPGDPTMCGHPTTWRVCPQTPSLPCLTKATMQTAQIPSTAWTASFWPTPAMFPCPRNPDHHCSSRSNVGSGSQAGAGRPQIAPTGLIKSTQHFAESGPKSSVLKLLSTDVDTRYWLTIPIGQKNKSGLTLSV